MLCVSLLKIVEGGHRKKRHQADETRMKKSLGGKDEGGRRKEVRGKGRGQRKGR